MSVFSSFRSTANLIRNASREPSMAAARATSSRRCSAGASTLPSRNGKVVPDFPDYEELTIGGIELRHSS
jgi:hypothetical protein